MAEENEGGVRQRSRRAPFISLSKALERTEEFKGMHGYHPVRAASAYKAWGYGEKSSGARQTLATLILYGLLDDAGSGDDRRIKISDAGKRYLIDGRPDERLKNIQKFALNPEIMQTLWSAWGQSPPGDDECRAQLIFDYGFTEAAADEMLAIYKDNITFAKMQSSDSIGELSAPGKTLPEDKPNSGSRPLRGPSGAAFFDQMMMAGFGEAGESEALNQIKILVDRDRLQIAGQNVDLEGIGTLRKMLESYETILRLSKRT